MTNQIMTKYCTRCGTQFTSDNRASKYCSRKCMIDGRRERARENKRMRRNIPPDKWKTDCYQCRFFKECHARIWDVAFVPYCFPGSAEEPNWRHQQFRREGKMEAMR